MCGKVVIGRDALLRGERAAGRRRGDFFRNRLGLEIEARLLARPNFTPKQKLRRLASDQRFLKLDYALYGTR